MAKSRSDDLLPPAVPRSCASAPQKLLSEGTDRPPQGPGPSSAPERPQAGRDRSVEDRPLGGRAKRQAAAKKAGGHPQSAMPAPKRRTQEVPRRRARSPPERRARSRFERHGGPEVLELQEVEDPRRRREVLSTSRLVLDQLRASVRVPRGAATAPASGDHRRRGCRARNRDTGERVAWSAGPWQLSEASGGKRDQLVPVPGESPGGGGRGDPARHDAHYWRTTRTRSRRATGSSSTPPRAASACC